MRVSREELEEERRRLREERVRQAVWEAEMVKKLGAKWFEMRDRWMVEAYRADVEAMRHPRIREAVLRAVLASARLREEAARRLDPDLYLHPPED